MRINRFKEQHWFETNPAKIDSSQFVETICNFVTSKKLIQEHPETFLAKKERELHQDLIKKVSEFKNAIQESEFDPVPGHYAPLPINLDSQDGISFSSTDSNDTGSRTYSSFDDIELDHEGFPKVHHLRQWQPIACCYSSEALPPDFLDDHHPDPTGNESERLIDVLQLPTITPSPNQQVSSPNCISAFPIENEALESIFEGKCR